MGPTWGPPGAHLGPPGPRWAPCWPHEPCYLSIWHAMMPKSRGISMELITEVIMTIVFAIAIMTIIRIAIIRSRFYHCQFIRNVVDLQLNAGHWDMWLHVIIPEPTKWSSKSYSHYRPRRHFCCHNCYLYRFIFIACLTTYYQHISNVVVIDTDN